MSRRILIITVTAALLASACSDDDAATTTATAPDPPSTTAADTTTTVGPTTTTAAAPTTTAGPTTTTTTLPDYPGEFAVHPGSPVITPGDWDSRFTAVPFVHPTDGEWLLFYSGGRGTRDSDLGLATSSDGVTWAKDPDASISEEGIARPIGWLGVAPQGDEWAMWYVEGFRVTNRDLYKATAPAPDGPWTETGEVTLPPDNEWDDYLTVTGVTLIDGTYWLAYAGFENGITPPSVGLLTSTDGEVWERRDPILEPEPGTWTEFGVVPANVLQTDEGLELFYMGFESETPSVSRFDHTFKLGRLISTDGGETWAPDNEGQPILDTGEFGWPGVTVAYSDGTYYVYLGDDLGGTGVKLITGTIP